MRGRFNVGSKNGKQKQRGISGEGKRSLNREKGVRNNSDYLIVVNSGKKEAED